MITIKKLLFLSAIVATVVGAYVVTTNGVMAQDSTSSHDTLIQKIATKFGLNADDVQEVFDEHRKDMQSQMIVKNEERLTKLVSDGKITEAQKQIILKKQTELQSQRGSNKNSLKDKTPEERKTLMEQHKTEMNAWAKENGIDPQYLFGGFGKGIHRMMNK